MRGLPLAGMDVLFASYGGGHVTMLRPVAQAIAKAGISVGFLGLTTAQEHLERHGMDYFGFAELEGADDPQVQIWGQELAGPERPNAAVSYRETVAYHGLNFRDLVAEMGETAARRHYSLHGRQGFLPVASMGQMLRTLRPRVVVATNSPRSERALFLGARTSGIPALCLVDLFAIQEAKWIVEPDYAKVICVLNEQVKAYLVQQGCEANAVAVTGNPAFDTLADPRKRAGGIAWRQGRGYGTGDKVILWASNVEPERHPFTGMCGDPLLPRRVEAELRRIVARHEGWHLVVRYHPSETVAFEPGPNVSLSGREEDLHALVHAADVVVVMASTVGLEAHLAGKPVVSVDASIFVADAPYSKMGVSTGVDEVDHLEAAIGAAVSSDASSQREASASGDATKAVSSHVLALLRQARA